MVPNGTGPVSGAGSDGSRTQTGPPEFRPTEHKQPSGKTTTLTGTCAQACTRTRARAHDLAHDALADLDDAPARHLPHAARDGARGRERQREPPRQGPEPPGREVEHRRLAEPPADEELQARRQHPQRAVELERERRPRGRELTVWVRGGGQRQSQGNGMCWRLVRGHGHGPERTCRMGMHCEQGTY